MSIQVQIYLLCAAVLALFVIQGMHSYLVLKNMGDTEKFGRLLRKLRRVVKGK